MGDLTGALDAVEAVISCIGPKKNISPVTLMSVGVAGILTECKRVNVRRFMMQSGIGLSDGREPVITLFVKIRGGLMHGERCKSLCQLDFAAKSLAASRPKYHRVYKKL